MQATSPVATADRRAPSARASIRCRTAVLSGRAVRYAVIEPRPTTSSIGQPTATEWREPLVWLHGWAVSPTLYLPALRGFAARTGRRVVAIALPGFGGSDPLPVYRQGVSGIARHLIDVIEYLGVADESPTGKVALAGHSFGGALSLRIGRERPDLISSLSLYCPAGGSENPLPLPGVFVSIFADGFHRWTPAALAAVGTNIARHPVAFTAAGLSAWCSDQIEDIHEVSRSRIPTVFVFADNDGVVTPGKIPFLQVPGVATEWVEGRHSWMLTDTDRFIDMLERHQQAHTEAAAQAPALAALA